jgi:hypothetical protein
MHSDIFDTLWQDCKDNVTLGFFSSIHRNLFLHYYGIGDMSSVASAVQTALSLVFDLAVCTSLSLRLSTARFVPRRNF